MCFYILLNIDNLDQEYLIIIIYLFHNIFLFSCSFLGINSLILFNLSSMILLKFSSILEPFHSKKMINLFLQFIK